MENGRHLPLSFDPAATIDHLATQIADAVRDLGRRGAVVAVSGGIDSSVSAALCARALGPSRVFCLLMPERASSPESTSAGRELADHLGTEAAEEPISDVLEALGCYSLQAEAIRRVVPDCQPSWGHKLVRSAPGSGLVLISLEVEDDEGRRRKVRLPADVYRSLISAMNLKQRVRKLKEYTWADRLHYAVIGTPNRLEFDQGFFVKSGDGLADIKPIAGLYKGQVYEVARALGLPERITGRLPTTDTFSLPQSQEEYFFGYPLETMDLLLWGRVEGVPAAELAEHTGLATDGVEAGYAEIDRRRATALYLHAPAIVLDPSTERPLARPLSAGDH
jgi:NAD+ synthase